MDSGLGQFKSRTVAYSTEALIVWEERVKGKKKKVSFSLFLSPSFVRFPHSQEPMMVSYHSLIEDFDNFEFNNSSTISYVMEPNNLFGLSGALEIKLVC